MENDGIKVHPDAQVQYTKFQSSAPPQMPPPGQDPPPYSPQRNVLGPENTVTTCQFCRASIRTAVKYTATSRTLVAAAICGLMCCLCCVPYCSDSAKNTDHYCPNCERYLGTYEK